MSKKNYGSYFKGEPTPVTEEVVEPVVEEVAEVQEPVVEEVPVEEVVESTPEPEVSAEPAPTIGVVINCSKLNVRTNPHKNSEVVATVNTGSELTIDISKSTLDWYKICTASGIEGYCMKQFVAVM